MIESIIKFNFLSFVTKNRTVVLFCLYFKVFEVWTVVISKYPIQELIFVGHIISDSFQNQLREHKRFLVLFMINNDALKCRTLATLDCYMRHDCKTFFAKVKSSPWREKKNCCTDMHLFWHTLLKTFTNKWNSQIGALGEMGVIMHQEWPLPRQYSSVFIQLNFSAKLYYSLNYTSL